MNANSVKGFCMNPLFCQRTEILNFRIFLTFQIRGVYHFCSYNNYLEAMKSSNYEGHPELDKSFWMKRRPYGDIECENVKMKLKSLHFSHYQAYRKLMRDVLISYLLN